MPKYHVGIADEYLKALGLIMVQFSTLELTQMICLILLLGDPHLAQLLVNELAFDRVRTLTLSICRMRRPEAADEMQELLGLVQEAAQKRNQVAHALWAVGQNKEVVQFARGRTADLFRTQAVNIEELEATADFIADVQRKLVRFAAKLIAPKAQEPKEGNE